MEHKRLDEKERGELHGLCFEVLEVELGRMLFGDIVIFVIFYSFDFMSIQRNQAFTFLIEVLTTFSLCST